MRRRLLVVPVAAIALTLVLTTPASAVSIVVDRTTVAVGETVVVFGDTTAPDGSHCAIGDQVTLISNAFVGHSEFAGEGAVFTPVDAAGHFRVSVTITSAVTPGTYTIVGRCGGGSLTVSATLTVTGLPRTGASTARDLELGLGVLLAGGLLVLLARRREPVSG
jgi:LPXTG-motif cell wall-anchored protein